MPWCEDCERYWAPSAMTPEGTCPTCGADLEAPQHPDHAPGADGGGADGVDEAEEKAPWHFKLLVVLLVAYLIYRGYEMFLA
jgi:hypothetical protein